MAKVIEVIATNYHVGSGKDDDPFRLIHELWTLDGRLIASVDHWKGESHVNRSVIASLGLPEDFA